MQICTNTGATLKVLKNAISSRTHINCLIRPSPSIFVQYAHTYPPRQYVLIRRMPLIRPYPSNAPVYPFHHPHVRMFVYSYSRSTYSCTFICTLFVSRSSFRALEGFDFVIESAGFVVPSIHFTWVISLRL
jgi:hypothetical protein